MFSLRWDQIDFVHKLIRHSNDLKTPGSTEPVPLTEIAWKTLLEWKKIQGSTSPFIFPSPRAKNKPISTVRTVWTNTLKRAGVPRFPIYDLRHAFCTRLCWVAADAVVTRAMRHTSPETKRRYQLGMLEQVREAMENANKKAYGQKRLLHFYDSRPVARKQQEKAVAK